MSTEFVVHEHVLDTETCDALIAWTAETPTALRCSRHLDPQRHRMWDLAACPHAPGVAAVLAGLFSSHASSVGISTGDWFAHIRRYGPGGRLAPHSDAAWSGVTTTVLLSDPATFEGGELMFLGPDGWIPAPAERGWAVTYSALSAVHAVTAIEAGIRLTLNACAPALRPGVDACDAFR